MTESHEFEPRAANINRLAKPPRRNPSAGRPGCNAHDTTKLDLGVVLLDSDAKVAKAYGISGLPQTFIVGKDGTVQAVFRGFSSSLEFRFASTLNAVINGEDIATARLKAQSASRGKPSEQASRTPRAFPPRNAP